MKIALITLSILFSFNTYSKGLKILVLGDSLTEGYGIAKSDAYPRLLELELQKKTKTTQVVNAGSSGSTTASALGRLKWQLKAPPQILLLALGANDGLRGVDIKVTKENLKKTIVLAKSKGIKVLLLGMQLPPNYGRTYTLSFKKMFFDLAKELEVSLMPFLLKNVGGVKKLNLPDGIHPNELGHKVIVKNLYPFVEKIIKEVK